jgi:hAT family C-terminal dimerisation region
LSLKIVLHPGLKLEYFRQHDWLLEWIKTAEDLVHEQYALKYKPALIENNGASGGVVASSGTDVADFSNVLVVQSVTNEIHKYLRKPVENVKDPLQWWVQNRAIYPTLSQMGLDYLSIPPTSTAVEHFFSRGRHLLPYTRSSLSAKSI